MPAAPTALPLVSVALDLLKKGERGKAKAVLEQALSANPRDVGALQLLGAVLVEESNPARAIGVLQQALALKPGHAGALNNLACAHFALGQYDDAITHFRALLAQRPDAPSIHYNLGNVLQASGRYGKAAAHYLKAYEGEPKAIQALSSYIYCCGMVCDWTNSRAYETFLQMAAAHAYVGPPIVLHALVDDPEVHCAAARRALMPHRKRRRRGWLLPAPTLTRASASRISRATSASRPWRISSQA